MVLAKRSVFLRKSVNVPRNRLGAGFERDGAFEINCLIFIVRDFSTVAIEVALAWTPAGGIPLGHDAMHPVGRKKAVLDSLAQAVGVYRVAEISIRVAIVLSQRRRRHAQLKGGLEVAQNLAPIAVVFGAAAMALVDDNQIEEILRIFFVKSGPVFVFGDRLVNREIHLAAFVDFAVLDLPAGVAESREHLVLGIVDQNIAVGEIENLRPAVLTRAVPAHVPELPADLESHRGLAGAGSHRQKNSFLALKNRLDYAVDGDFLVVTLAFANG